ncbi:MAG: hypothetical protein FJZ90_10140 [Chloroflexi bacterium]|nr:hypothetical protein [Chloroflexota bacterium]
MFSSPIFLLGSTLATAWAALFHLLLGKHWTDLILYWFIGLIGFAVGQAMADILGLRFFLLGQVHLLEATLGCWTAMLVARWLQV